MKFFPVISGKNQLVGFPLNRTITWWLFLKFIYAGDVWFGVFYTISGLWWLLAIGGFLLNVVNRRKTFEVDENGEIKVV